MLLQVRVRVMSVQVPVVSVYLHVAADFVLFLTLELIAFFGIACDRSSRLYEWIWGLYSPR